MKVNIIPLLVLIPFLKLSTDTPFEYGYLSVGGSGAFYNAEFYTNPGLDYIN